jgi:5-aminolevulinic acid synthase
MSKYEALHQIESQMRQAGLIRQCTEVEPGRDAKHVHVNGREIRMFCTNDYLGLSRDPSILREMQRAITRYGCGAGGSRIHGGTRGLHHRLEMSLAAFHCKSDAVLFSNGYMANLGAISTLAQPEDLVFSDSANHASIIDGIRLSSAKILIWRHNDVAHLQQLLKNHTSAGKRIVVCESLYAIDGDFAPLKEILKVAHAHDCLTYVDEVHAVGLYGPHGEGYAAQLGLADQVDILMSGAGNAFGTLGGYVACNDVVSEVLKSRSRSFMFTTSLPPAILAATLKALDMVIDGAELRSRVHRNCTVLRKLLDEHNFNYLDSKSHIFPIVTGSAKSTRKATSRLMSRGIYAQGATYPFAPMHQGRLRLTVTPHHSEEDLAFLVQCLRQVRDEVKDFGTVENQDEPSCAHLTPRPSISLALHESPDAAHSAADGFVAPATQSQFPQISTV